MAFLEEQHNILLKQGCWPKHAAPDSAAVITIQGHYIKWVPVQEMVEHADMENRRGKDEFWRPYADLVEALVARTQLLQKTY